MKDRGSPRRFGRKRAVCSKSAGLSAGRKANWLVWESEMLKGLFSYFCVAILTFSIAAGMVAAQEHKGPAWTYSGQEGPDRWGELDKEFATCRLGQRQSPIDIRAAKKSELPAIQFDYKASPLHIINNGHTIQVNYASGSFITVGDKPYELKQFHFHHPSEEKIQGKDFLMVVHLVHADSQGNLAVVAVLLDGGNANHLIEDLWKRVPQHPGPQQQFEDVQIQVADLLPANRGYYTFTGSLTTPPCSENVTWIVLKAPLHISKEQAETFGKIYPHNARPTQPLNGRDVKESQ
jgi:carbonic anhydrase